MSNISDVRCIREAADVSHGSETWGISPRWMDGWIEGLMDGGRGLVGLRSFSSALHDRIKHEGRVMEAVEGVIEEQCVPDFLDQLTVM